MPQNEYMDRHTRLHGRRLDHEERQRKKEARKGHKASEDAQNLRGLRAKLHQQARRKEKIQMRKQIKAHEERDVKNTAEKDPSTPMPSYLLDRSNPTAAKALSSAIKNKRNEKSARFSVPLPKVKGISEEEMFRVVSTGKKTQKKGWKRMVTKPTFVGPDFTRRPVKYERFIRPMGLRYKKANVTHKELGVTVQLSIISVKKNPSQPLYTQLGVLTKGTVLEVNVSELGLTTATGKVVWGHLVQIAPAQFEKHSRVAIEDNLNAKYSNRVIQKIGLCICMYDLLWASEGLIGHGTGLVNVNVEFRLIVFRPFKGETLLGKISSATPEGINIRTDFFEEIFVPYKELPESCEFDHNEQAWTWVVDEDRMFYDKNEMVRLSVIDEMWHDQVPESTADDAVEKAKKLSPYSIRGTMMKEGLGVCIWWDDA